MAVIKLTEARIKALPLGSGITRDSEVSGFFVRCHKTHKVVWRPGRRPKKRSRHLVTAPSHRSCDLLLKATRGVTIAVVSSRERKRRQPGLATDDPAFVGWHQLVRGIQGS